MWEYVWEIDSVYEHRMCVCVCVCVCVWARVCEDCDGMCNTVAVFSVSVVNLSISSNDKEPLFASMNK